MGDISNRKNERLLECWLSIQGNLDFTSKNNNNIGWENNFSLIMIWQKIIFKFQIPSWISTLISLNTFLFVLSASSNLLIISITGSQFRKTLKVVLRFDVKEDSKVTTTVVNTRRTTTSRKNSRKMKEAHEMKIIANSVVSIHEGSPSIMV